MLRLCLLILFLAPAIESRAQCDCLWQGSFAEIHQETDLIISAEVVAQKGNSIDIKRLRLLRGVEPLETVRIWLKTADYCRPPVDNFPPGSTWVMALERIETEVPGGFNPSTPNISYGRIGDYSLSNCGGYWLQQNGSFVSGNLINAPRWERDPKMTPVLVDLIAAFVNGEIGRDALLEASREDPALRELMLDTKQFLRANQ